MTNIAIDARWLHLGGLGTYTYNLLTRLRQQAEDLALCAIVNRKNVKHVEAFCSRVAISDASMYTVREQLEIPWAARGARLLHVPHYNAPLLYSGPLVVSIHDLIHLTEPLYRDSLRSWGYARPMLNLTARKAEHIITVSEYSKSQLVELLGVRSSKISVIYSGVDPQFHPLDDQVSRDVVARELGIQAPYVLYVGNLKPHKNVTTLFNAMGDLSRRRSIPHKLVIIGGDPKWGAARREECRRAGITNRTYFIPRVPQELLPLVYVAADVLVMPSTLEGFGLPVLEAMACGTPVICSRAASLPEVGGDAVLYFDPLSSEDLAQTIDRLLDSKDLQETLYRKGLERATKFDWNSAVREHVRVYRHLLGSN